MNEMFHCAYKPINPKLKQEIFMPKFGGWCVNDICSPLSDDLANVREMPGVLQGVTADECKWGVYIYIFF